jgi:hypothetical protein
LELDNYQGRHRCAPEFRVWDAEGEPSEARAIFAIDAQSAAEEWAERCDVDSADYTIVGGDEVRVCVMRAADFGACDVDEETGAITFGERRVWRFEVTGETVAQYHAKLLEQSGKL